MIVLVLNGSLLRSVTLVSHWASRSALLLTFSPTFVRVLTAHSQARRGPTYPVTVMFYTPREAVQLLETMAIALDRRVVRLCRHLSKNMNCEAER